METAFKESTGLPLEQSVLLKNGLLDSKHLERLRALSITTVDELLGLVQSANEEVYTFLDVDLAQLQADADPPALARVMSAWDELSDLRMPLGAAEPPGVDVEPVALLETFEEYASYQPVTAESIEAADLRGCFGPVRHQGDRPTCVAHAGGALAECLHRHAHGSLISFSPQFLYFQAKRRDGAPNLPGTWSKDALPTLVTEGICEEVLWPYEPDELPGDPTHGNPSGAATADAAGHKALRIDVLDPRSSRQLRSTLLDGRPVSISVPVYSNWWSTSSRQFGEITMPVPSSRLEGGHAVCVAGFEWDDEFTGGGYFIFRNSWGTEWAPASPIAAGYGVIPFEYIDRYGWEAFTAVMG